MTRRSKWLLVALFIASPIAFVVLLVKTNLIWWVLAVIPPPADREPFAIVPAPGGDYVATGSYPKGGATNDSTTIVTIRSIDPHSNSNPEYIVLALRGRYPVDIAWSGPKALTLQLTEEANAAIVSSVRSWDDLMIEIKEAKPGTEESLTKP